MSQKKKIQEKRKKEQAAANQSRKQKGMIIGLVAVLAVVAGIVAGAIIFDYSNKEKTYELNYSTGLDADGSIAGVNASDYVTISDPDAINTNASDFIPSESEEKEYIEKIVSSYPELSDKAGVVVNDGDSIKIKYTATLNGEVKDQMSTGDEGTMMTIGGGEYPPQFEDEIKGKKTGDTFTVKITFPDTFDNVEIAGKEVEYETTILGVYSYPEFNDEFVKKNFAGIMEDADDFLERYRRTTSESKYDTYVTNYFYTESVVKSYPNGFLKKMREFEMAKDQKQLEATNQTYANLYNMKAYLDVYDMRGGITKKEYKEYIDNAAKEDVKDILIKQALCDRFGITVTEDDIMEVVSSYGFTSEEKDQAIERFGEPYLYQQAKFKVLEKYLTDTYNLNN